MKKLLLLLPVIFLVIIFFVFFRPQKSLPLIAPLLSLTDQPTPLPTSTYQVYGFLPYWTASSAQLPSQLTTISFFSLPIQPDGHIIDPAQDTDPGARSVAKGELSTLKQTGKHIELTLTMMDQDGIEQFVSNSNAGNTLLTDLGHLMTQYPIDGADLDIEYVRTPTPAMQQAFSSILHTVYAGVKKQNSAFQLSIAMLSDSGEHERLTAPNLVAPYIDRAVVMAYDYHRKGSTQSGANAPLYGNSETAWGKNIMSGLKGITDAIPPQKILLGIPFYGYQWGVDGTDIVNFTLPQSGKTVTYEQIQELLSTGKATRFFDQTSLSPYILYTKNGVQQQIYYDDTQSIGYKLDLVRDAHLGGIAIWALGFEGQTHELWNEIQEKLQ
ncbi:hypothetical protein C5B42_03495 [Candidatus Cerribacteria bacterium 'Amazon FNV 2010 28 9']|uniref:chitinase n=1 Tax=Candidatus Cerribacteria bacterium 'Amazon FNV 2010 28 9' TaxID=2081795 RepID=A0A317JPZ2_9BACT|nr:MAG: hypothetical protein C5B42_03495 [Candidatus Cerribacteria bacterium 'Amazon FNV 2010 28 9']